MSVRRHNATANRSRLPRLSGITGPRSYLADGGNAAGAHGSLAPRDYNVSQAQAQTKAAEALTAAESQHRHRPPEVTPPCARVGGAGSARPGPGAA